MVYMVDIFNINSLHRVSEVEREATNNERKEMWIVVLAPSVPLFLQNNEYSLWMFASLSGQAVS